MVVSRVLLWIVRLLRLLFAAISTALAMVEHPSSVTTVATTTTVLSDLL